MNRSTSVRFFGLDVLPHTMSPALLVAILISILLLALCILGLPERAELSSDPKLSRGDTGLLTLKDILESTLDNYAEKLERFDANLRLQAALIVVGLLLILRRSDTLSFSGNNIPLRWLHVLVPCVLMYLWLSFGFLLDDLVDTRIRLAEMIRAGNHENWRLVATLAYDSGFIDGWIISFVDSRPGAAGRTDEFFGDCSGIDHNFAGGTAFLLVTNLGTLAAATHACALALLTVGARRYTRASDSVRLALYYAAPILPLIVFALSHVAFAYHGRNSNWLQLYIAVVTVILYVYLLRLAAAIDLLRMPETVNCLKRSRTVRTNLSKRDQRMEPSVDLRVALIGDSLSTSFSVDRMHVMLKQMWFGWSHGWLSSLVAHHDPPLQRTLSRLGYWSGVEIHYGASVRAAVGRAKRRRIGDWLTNTFHFKQQVDELSNEPFPDLVLLWIGHNEVTRLESLDQEQAAACARDFKEQYARQLDRLIAMAIKSAKPATIIVFGLINFDSFFMARSACEELHARNDKLYRFLERSNWIFPSMLPQHRSKMILLARHYNASLLEYCQTVAERSESGVTLLYSDALANVDIGSADMLSPKDAWHPSEAGRVRLAEAAWPVIEEALIRLANLRVAAGES